MSLTREDLQGIKKLVDTSVTASEQRLHKQVVALGYRLDQRIDETNGRIDGVNERVAGMSERMDGMGKRIDAMNARFEATERRLHDQIVTLGNRLDERIDETHVRLDAM